MRMHVHMHRYNSMPNQLPLFCGVSPDELPGLNAEQCIWDMFKKHGGVTMMAEEIHDNCQSSTTTVSAVWRTAMSVQSNELPDHQWWRLFCSPHIKPCCWAKSGWAGSEIECKAYYEHTGTGMLSWQVGTAQMRGGHWEAKRCSSRNFVQHAGTRQMRWTIPPS